MYKDHALGQLFRDENAIDLTQMIEDQINNIRTGEDAISFFARNGPNTRLKFVYCNRKPVDTRIEFCPYDLVAVPQDKVAGGRAVHKTGSWGRVPPQHCSGSVLGWGLARKWRTPGFPK